LHLSERGKDVGVKHFVAVGAIEALDEGVLIGLAGLDEAHLDVVRSAPVRKELRREFWAVVEAQRCGTAVDREELLEYAEYARGRDRRADFNRERFPIRLIEDVS
jgi:hypothetical protein